MAQCELCGKDADLVIGIIEEIKLNLCATCSTHSRIVHEVKVSAKIKPQESENVEDIKSNFSTQIKQAREQQSLTQKELARKLNLKESMLQKFETGKLKPSLQLAKKLESVLNIYLIETTQIEQEGYKPTKSQGLTIGDLIKL